MENFLRSRMIDKLINKDIPQIAEGLASVSEEMKRANDLKGKELELKEAELDLLRQIHKIGSDNR